MSVQTIDGRVFDGIVYAEVDPQTWLSGSDHHRRTQRFHAPQENDADGRPVRIIITYQADGTITAYRDGKPYGKSYKTEPIQFAAGKSLVVFGTRHGTSPDPGRALTGKIFEARLYDRALSPQEVTAASSGTLMDIVTDQMVAAALLPAQAIKVLALDQEIADLSAEANKLASELDSHRARSKASGDAFFRITHGILNSKELIYVY